MAAVSFEFDGEYFYVGEHGLITRKHRNVSENPIASLVIDDILTNPQKFRMIKIGGPAVFVERTGYMGTGKYIGIKSVHRSSYGI